MSEQFKEGSIPLYTEITNSKERVPISETTGIIFAGGAGSRMREVTGGKLSKPVVPLRDSFVLMDSPVLAMRSAGIQKISILTTEVTIKSVSDHMRGAEMYEGVDCFIGGEIDPTCGTIPPLKYFLEETGIDTPLIKANADVVFFTQPDIEGMYSAHNTHDHPVTEYLTDEERRGTWFKYELTADGRVVAIHAPPHDEADGRILYNETGLSVIDPIKFDDIRAARKWGDFIRGAMDNGEMYGYPTSTSSINVNTPADLAIARREFHKE